MAERELWISHPIGAQGRFRLVTASGTLRVEGIDGDTAEVRARYRAPAGGPMTDDPEADGVLEVSREEDGLTVQVRDAGGSGFIAGLARKAGAYRPDVDFEVRVPRGATIRLETTSADGELHGLRGEQDLRTVSGDLELHASGGHVKVTSVSGDVAIAGDVLWLSASTTSGDVAVDAELVQQLTARAVSGDISIRAAFGRDVVHTFESVSGDLQVATASGVAVDMSGLSGSVRSEQPSRRESRDGRTRLVVGDGATMLRARTVSGDVVITGPRGETGTPRGTADPFGFAAEMASFGREMAAFGVGLARDVTANAMGTRRAGWPTPPTPPTPPRPPSAPIPPAWSAGPGASPPPPTATTTPSSPAAADQLAILRQLEAGEIDVEEAARRLEALA